MKPPATHRPSPVVWKKGDTGLGIVRLIRRSIEHNVLPYLLGPGKTSSKV